MHCRSNMHKRRGLSNFLRVIAGQSEPFRSKRLMFSTVLADLRHKARWYDLPATNKSVLRMLLTDGSATQILYRAMRFCQTHHLKPFAFVIYRLNIFCSHAVIGRGAEFGDGLIVLHTSGIVVNSKVKAGKNLVLEHGVTIGEEKNRCPVLG